MGRDFHSSVLYISRNISGHTDTHMLIMWIVDAAVMMTVFIKG